MRPFLQSASSTHAFVGSLQLVAKHSLETKSGLNLPFAIAASSSSAKAGKARELPRTVTPRAMDVTAVFTRRRIVSTACCWLDLSFPPSTFLAGADETACVCHAGAKAKAGVLARTRAMHEATTTLEEDARATAILLDVDAAKAHDQHSSVFTCLLF